MGDIFNLDNKFFQTLGKGVDCVCLSLLWMICCIPLAFGIYVAYVDVYKRQIQYGNGIYRNPSVPSLIRHG